MTGSGHAERHGRRDLRARQHRDEAIHDPDRRGGVSRHLQRRQRARRLVGTLSYDPTHVYLNFALDFGAKSSLNVNQQNVANALTDFFNANGGIPAVFAS